MVSSFRPVDLSMSAACSAFVRSFAFTHTLTSMLYVRASVNFRGSTWGCRQPFHFLHLCQVPKGSTPNNFFHALCVDIANDQCLCQEEPAYLNEAHGKLCCMSSLGATRLISGFPEKVTVSNPAQQQHRARVKSRTPNECCLTNMPGLPDQFTEEAEPEMR